MLHFGHSPEELQRIHEYQRSRWERINSAIETSNADQLKAWLELITMAVHEPHVLFYYKGIIEKMMTDRHGHCPCGTDHAEEIAQAIHPTPPTETPEPPAAPAHPISLVGDIELLNGNLKKYRMHIINGDLRCRDCGIKYVSMEDRMLKAPDDCHGCEVKSKWG